jgi:hypothetical protein
MVTSGYETQAIMKWWLTRAARHEPKNEPGVGMVLYHGMPMYLLSFCCFAASIFIIILSLFVVPSNTPGNGPIYSVIALSIFIVPAFYSLFEAVSSRVVVNENEISVKTFWSKNPKVIRWNEIYEVSYSGLWSSLIIQKNDGKKLKFLGYFYGIRYLAECFENHLNPNVYNKAAGFIIQVYESSKLENITKKTPLEKVASKVKNNWQRGRFALYLGFGCMVAGLVFTFITGDYSIMLVVIITGIISYMSGIFQLIKSDKSVIERVRWGLGSFLVLVIIVGAGSYVYPRVIPPSNSVIAFDHSSSWINPGSSIHEKATITNNSDKWSISNVTVTIRALDNDKNVLKTYVIHVRPTIILPKSQTNLEQDIQIPQEATLAKDEFSFTWVRP